MKIFTTFSLSLALLSGCSTIRPDVVAVAETTLLTILAGRDTQTLDLAKVGQDLIAKYGKETAVAAVHKAWDDQSKSAPHTQVKNMMWLQSQPPRVRDLAWLLNYQSEWVK